MHLLDFTDREFRRIPSSYGNSLELGPTVRQSISPPCGTANDGEPLPDIVEGAMDCRNHEDLPAVGHDIPQWLQRDQECDAVDWLKVARRIARKPRMISVIAKALTLRAAGFSRSRAVAAAASKAEARAVEAAWKWVDREWQRTIVPLFHREDPPLISPIKVKSSRPSFIPPADSLKSILARRISKAPKLMTVGPSLQVPVSLPRKQGPGPTWRYRFEDGTGLRGLRPDSYAVWDGSTMILGRTDLSSGFVVRAETLAEALDTIREERERPDGSDLSRLFLGSPNKKWYSRRAGVYFVEPNSLRLDATGDVPEESAP